MHASCLVSSRLVSSHQISSQLALKPHQYAFNSSHLATGMEAWLGQTKIGLVTSTQGKNQRNRPQMCLGNTKNTISVPFGAHRDKGGAKAYWKGQNQGRRPTTRQTGPVVDRQGHAHSLICAVCHTSCQKSCRRTGSYRRHSCLRNSSPRHKSMSAKRY